jgi:mono/diheme cytochrome c family protein
MTRRLMLALSIPVAIGLTWPASALRAQHHAQPPGQAEEEHEGDPKDWKFTLPKGNPVRGRRVFVRFECYACHEVKGERFRVQDPLGRELSHMGQQHSAEFIAESILNPSAFIDPEPRFRGPDGSSRMPSFNDLMTMQELIDLVAYIRGLRPPAALAGSRAASPTPRAAPAPGGPPTPPDDDHKH